MQSNSSRHRIFLPTLSQSIAKRLAIRARWGLVGSTATAALLAAATAWGSTGISGTMSNFDVFNDTPTDAYGAEIELEDVPSSQVVNTFPSHFQQKTIEDYSDIHGKGTRIRFSGYNFHPQGFLSPTVGQSTNGHFCVNIPGCEHFGFSVGQQPTTTRFYWLDQNLQRIGANPLAIPNPTWTYVPPQRPGDLPVVRAEVAVPEPAEFHAQLPDSIWMKVYKTELERPVGLQELMSNGGVSPEDESETETEWELLEGGKMDQAEDEVREDGKAVIRRYEFFKYTGPYDAEHEPTSLFLDEEMDEPPAGELGAFISANMVAANLGELAAPGDFNGNGSLDTLDIDMLVAAIRSGQNELLFDLDSDMQVDAADLSTWVVDLRKTWFGDSNLDDEFNSTDLITVFQAGEYEDEAVGNSSWSTGDWTADGEFDSSDLIAAFQQGGYEAGPMAAVAVPEPSGLGLVPVALLSLFAWFRRSSR